MARIAPTVLLLLSAAVLACTKAESNGASTECAEDAGADAGPDTTPVLPDAPPLSATRLLRKVSLRLVDQAPSMEDYEALLALTDDAARDAFLADYIDKLITSPAFYRNMLSFGHDILKVTEANAGFQGEAYIGQLSPMLTACEMGTKHPGTLFTYSGAETASSLALCNDDNAVIVDAEPWWAPGTTVPIFERFSPGPSVGTGNIACSQARGSLYETPLPDSGCGCGPNLRYCQPKDFYWTWGNSNMEVSARRMVWDEPARLWAHVIWNDRPLSDVVLANYSVAPVALKHTYLRSGQRVGVGAEVDGIPFFRASDYASTPSDPEHAPDSPLAWHEFVVERLHPRYLSLAGATPSAGLDRTYTFDPRTEAGEPKGIPFAGVLTSLGMLSAFPRERVRGARMMEVFACRDFTPPAATQKFNEYKRDPATEGSCQHCHTALDPASIFFKRAGNPTYGTDRMWAGFADGFWDDKSPTYSEPWIRWTRVFQPDTRLTPVSEAQMKANPNTRFIDFLPPEQTLLGLKGDGTIGPLGFGKIVVQSGEFDRCMTRRIHQHIVGRDLGADETATLDELTAAFVSDGRNVRKMIKRLMKREEFRRGL